MNRSYYRTTWPRFNKVQVQCEDVQKMLCNGIHSTTVLAPVSCDVRRGISLFILLTGLSFGLVIFVTQKRNVQFEMRNKKCDRFGQCSRQGRIHFRKPPALLELCPF